MPPAAVVTARLQLAVAARDALAARQCFADYAYRVAFGAHDAPAAVAALLEALAAFRAAWPMYAPLHVACYLAHAAQEHLAIGGATTNGKLANAEGKKVD